MLKWLILIIISFSIFAADEHATISMQRSSEALVVTINHEPKWHTYWKNPGDAGIATTFKFFDRNNKEIKLKAYEWPKPEKYIEAGEILTIGYEGAQHFFFEKTDSEISAQITYLICKDLCIPGQANLKLKANEKFTSSKKASPFPEADLKKAFDNLPVSAPAPKGFDFYLTRKPGENLLTLHYSLTNVQDKKFNSSLMFLTPFPQVPFGFKRESIFWDGNTLHGKTEIEWDGIYQEPEVPLPESGEFTEPYYLDFLINVPGSNKIETISIEVKNFSLDNENLDLFYKNLGNTSTAAMASGFNFFQYLVFAFLGGLILNLMPCVLPVISLKLFGLIKNQNMSRSLLIRHNFSYMLGVISTFLALASVIVALKYTGEEVGWGFQLQSPGFILIMMLVLFILSLNLFGLFEFMTPGGSKLGGAQLKDSFVGDFFSGVLTTILSTPCSAPFLGTALTFAFTTDTFTIYAMFIAIGLGLSFPFLITALFPASLKILPRPGMWMEKLKYFLGLSLVVTIIWLYDVFVSLVNFDVISWKLNLLFVLWFFAFFFAQKISKNKLLIGLMFLIPVSLTVLAIQNLELRPTGTVKESQGQWAPWTEEKMNAMNEDVVFIDFTAEWCLTCKVNKKLVLDTSGFSEFTEKHNLKLMRADWTKRDDNITRFLKKYGAIGVPAYFIKKKNGEVVFLGETISISKIEEHLK